MPARMEAALKIAEVLGVLAHPHRIRLVEELALGSQDVQGLERLLKIPQSSVSQHLSQLKKLGVVHGVREGRRVIYGLSRPWIAGWLLEALRLAEDESRNARAFQAAATRARKIWKSGTSA